VPLTETFTSLVDDPRKYLTLVYGVAGVGKTSWCAQIPNHYFLMAEYGVQGVSVRGDPVPTWTSFQAKCSELRNARGANWTRGDGTKITPIEVVIIDTYDKLFENTGIHVCANERFMEQGKAEKYDKIDDVPWGKGYARVSDLLLHEIEALMLSGFGVVVVSHLRARQAEYMGRKNMEFYGPNLSPRAAERLVDACGAVGYFYIDEKVEFDKEVGAITKVEQGRFARWQATLQLQAKHRMDFFPETLPLRKLEGWQDYCEAFKTAYERAKKERGIV